MNSTHGIIGGRADGAPALVVVFLRGGADGLTLVPPTEDDAYYNFRPHLGVKRNEALPLDDIFGLHPELAPLHRAYAYGDLLVVHQAGSEDTSRSHFEAQDYMEHGGLAGGGWLGRFLRSRPGEAAGPLAAVAIGKTQPESLRGAPASVAFETLEDLRLGQTGEGFRAGLEALYSHEEGLLGAAGRDVLKALDRIEDLRATPYRPAAGVEYPDNDFGRGLREVARLVKARVGVEAATVDLGGWDAHFASTALMNPLMRTLAAGLDAFVRDLGDDLARTTVVVMTEFGRRVRENASFGTDHGRAGTMFILGGGIRGGRVLADWKGLHADRLEEPGDLPVAHNYRDVLAPILIRHGAPNRLDAIFPGHIPAPLDIYA